MLSLPEQSIKCYLNADLNGQLELDTKEPQVADIDFDILYMFSVEGIYYPVNKDNVLAYFYDEFFDEYLVIKKGFYSDCNWKHPDEKFWKVQQEWDLINPL
ncbi:hypothetical protein [Bacillus sp. BPN334]|uniref:hypothetical protein n=1 Tax=Bacillus sp. BPN334 TaxID=2217815 RepID=UPI0011EC3964|nr:hypothetical protein [Bacillus sp. BPN334]KAA0794938.1 hypothetical protein DN393_00725 [Bacillus sp. BPN334]